jgi:hypothetical protein
MNSNYFTAELSEAMAMVEQQDMRRKKALVCKGMREWRPPFIVEEGGSP